MDHRPRTLRLQGQPELGEGQWQWVVQGVVLVPVLAQEQMRHLQQASWAQPGYHRLWSVCP